MTRKHKKNNEAVSSRRQAMCDQGLQHPDDDCVNRVLRCSFPSARWETSAETVAEAETAAVDVDSAGASVPVRIGSRTWKRLRI